MKGSDLPKLIIAGILLIVAIFVAVTFIMPKKGNGAQNSTYDVTVKQVPEEIDEKTYEQVKNLSDYGKPELNDIGKEDLFSNF